MFAIPVIEKNLEIIAAMNNGLRPLVQVPNAMFIYTNETTVPYIMDAADFRALREHNDMSYHTLQAWTI